MAKEECQYLTVFVSDINVSEESGSSLDQERFKDWFICMVYCCCKVSLTQLNQYIFGVGVATADCQCFAEFVSDVNVSEES